MYHNHANLWREPATLLTHTTNKRRAFWASIISTLLTIVVMSGMMLMLNWTGVQVPAMDKFDDAARTD
jgi:hypothetical protein